VHLVIDQVVQLQVVHVADGDLTLEGFAGAAIEQGHLAGGRHAGQLQHGLDFLFLGTVEHRRRERHACVRLPARSMISASFSWSRSSALPFEL
jgi:hypothetical protein